MTARAARLLVEAAAGAVEAPLVLPDDAAGAAALDETVRPADDTPLVEGAAGVETWEGTWPVMLPTTEETFCEALLTGEDDDGVLVGGAGAGVLTAGVVTDGTVTVGTVTTGVVTAGVVTEGVVTDGTVIGWMAAVVDGAPATDGNEGTDGDVTEWTIVPTGSLLCPAGTVAAVPASGWRASTASPTAALAVRNCLPRMPPLRTSRGADTCVYCLPAI